MTTDEMFGQPDEKLAGGGEGHPPWTSMHWGRGYSNTNSRFMP